MKIGIFTDTYTPDINGVVSSIVTLEKGLIDAGHEVYIITGLKGARHSSRSGNVLRLPGLELKKLYGYTLSTPYDFALKEEIEKLNLDLIHVQQEFTVGVFGRIMAHKLRLPVIYTYHTMYEDYTHYVNLFDINMVEKVSKKAVYTISKRLCDNVSGIVAPSIKTKEKLQSYGVTRPIYVIPTGLELERFKRENIDESKLIEIKNQYGIKDSDKVIVYLGRIANEKSIDMIVDGAKYLKEENTKILIVGGGPSLEGLKQLAINNNVSDKVIFTGAVNREEVPLYYALSDCFVSASTSETQGITYIEALASGLCVFARRDEVLDELIYEDKNGFYFDDAKEFALKVEQYLMMSKERQEEIKLNALESVKRFDIKKFISDMVTIYDMAIRDYEDCYTISKIVSASDCMRLYLHNKKHKLDETLLMSLDDYMYYRLKKDDVIEMYVYESLKRSENVLLAKRSCIHRLTIKDYTRKQMYDYLMKQIKYELTIEDINTIIDELEEKGFINDEAYTAMQVSKMDHALIGKRKILKDLVEKGIPFNKIEEHLSSLNEEDEKEKCMSKALKYNEAIHNRSIKEKKEIMIGKLSRDGFSFDLAKQCVNELDFEKDKENELVYLKNTLDKIYKSYVRKYEGKNLYERMLRHGLNKGYKYDDIVSVLKEGGYINEED